MTPMARQEISALGRDIGYFRSSGGHHTLDIELLSDASILNVGNPRLKIEADGEGYNRLGRLYDQIFIIPVLLVIAGGTLILLDTKKNTEAFPEIPSSCIPRLSRALFFRFKRRTFISGLPSFALIAALVLLLLFVPLWIVTFWDLPSKGIAVLLSQQRRELTPSGELLDPLVLKIDKQSRWFLNDASVVPEQLPSALTQALSKRKDWYVYFDADPTLSFDVAARAIDVIRKSRAKVILVTPNTRNMMMSDRTLVPALNRAEAQQLSELMCRQLPNVSTILENIWVQSSEIMPPQEPIVTDDVYDALMRLGPYSLSCLIKKLADTRWMPDPRSEPLLGVPVVGDVAYMILADKGVKDLLPTLAHRKPEDLRMDDYFLWPGIADHRKRLQNAVSEWAIKHPDCCGKPPVIRNTAPSTLKSKMSSLELDKARREFSLLHLGMSTTDVLRIKGKPDAIDTNADNSDHWHTSLLGFCANNHNEKTAYIYFTERWADEIDRRDPLRDRYVIVFFSAENKLIRIFSNVAVIPPMFPSNEVIWERLMWGAPARTNADIAQ